MWACIRKEAEQVCLDAADRLRDEPPDRVDLPSCLQAALASQSEAATDAEAVVRHCLAQAEYVLTMPYDAGLAADLLEKAAALARALTADDWARILKTLDNQAAEADNPTS